MSPMAPVGVILHRRSKIPFYDVQQPFACLGVRYILEDCSVSIDTV